MDDRARTPAHLWIVGIVSALWNSYGAYDYTMTHTGNQAYLAQYSAEQRAYFETMATVPEVAWTFGVWGALIGSLLLLARSRHAVFAFALSLTGLAVNNVYQFALATPGPHLEGGGELALHAIIWAVAIGLLVYALAMRRRLVLR